MDQEKKESNVLKEKLKALELTIDKIEKGYGKGTIMKMGDKPIADIPSIPSGSLSLDVALGIGGYPKGRVIEIFGPESSGKTTLALHAMAEAQKNGGIAAFIDAEHAFDRFYAENLGVDIENLLISQPDNGEQALEIVDHLIRSGAIDIIVIDSVAALTPRAEIEGEMGDSRMGLQARLMSQALRKLTANINKTNTCCMFINQLREKIGVMFGNPETTTGGHALKFYLLFGVGISKTGEIIDLGVDFNIIKKSGSWFSYGDTKLGQGREGVRQILADNPELLEEINGKIVEAFNTSTTKKPDS